MTSTPSVAEVHDAVEARGSVGTPVTTPEVSESFECSDRTIYNRLETLVDNDILQTKKVGARGRVWWQPTEKDTHKRTRSHERYQPLFEQINKGVCVVEVLFNDADQPVDGKFNQTNSVFDELTGLQNAAGKRIRELDLEYAADWIETFGQVVQTGESIHFTQSFDQPEGQRHEINAVPIGEPHGQTVAVLIDDSAESDESISSPQQNDDRFEALIEATTEGVYRISPDWSEIYELASEGFVADDRSMSWKEYLPDDEQERVGAAIEEAIETQSPFEMEHRVKRADGTIGWTHSGAVPIIEDGEIVEWFGTATDITERKEREQEIKSQQEWREAIFEGSRDAVFISDTDANFVEVNAAASDLTGYDREELLSMRIPDLHEDVDLDAYREHNDRILDGESMMTEDKLLRADGSKVHVEFSNKRIEIDDDVYMHTTARNVSKQKQREVELKQRKALLESVSELICLVDKDGIIQYDSSRVTEILGYGSDERLGDSGFEYVHPDDRSRIKREFHETVTESGTTELYEYRAKTKDSGWVWVESSARNLTDDPDVNGIIVSIRDITKSKEQQRRRETLIDNLPGIAYRCRNEKGWPMDTVEGNCKELTGYDQSIFESNEMLWGREIIHPNDRDKVWETAQEGIQQDNTFQITYRTVTSDGDQRWMWERGKRVLPVSESDPIIEGFITDVTEREQLKRKQQQIINRVTDGIIELDADWQFEFLSGQGGELADISEDDVLGQTLWEVFDNIQGTTFEKQYREVMETREMASFVEYYQAIDSWFDVQAYPNDHGGIDIYFRDVTERKESEQAHQRAEKQYQTLLDLAPLPIIVADSTTGEIIEANEAVGKLLGYQADEIVGHGKEILRPEGQAEAYDETFRRAVQEEGTFRTLPDGSPYQIMTKDGERISVEISVRTVTLDGKDVAYGILRDITDERQYQHRLAVLNDVTRELFDAETQRDVKQQAVETLADLLDVPTVSFYSFEEKKWKLLPEVSKTAAESSEPPVLDPGSGVEWQAIKQAQTLVVDDVEAGEIASDFERNMRSKVAIPVADHGVLVASDPQPDVFSGWTVSLAETLSATVTTALERAEREQHLKTQRKELQEVESVNERIRGITRDIVQTETRADLEQSVCERLVASNLIDFAWIGRVDLETDVVTPQAQAGLGGTYLSDISLSMDGETDPEPSVAALQSREACHYSNTAADIQRGGWRTVAVEQGFQSVLSIPIKHEDALYGVLNVYTQTNSGYQDIFQSVLSELCDLIADTIYSMEQTALLQSEQTVELEFEIRDPTNLFFELAAEVECDLELEGVVSKPDESALVFVNCVSDQQEKVLQATDRLDGIEGANILERADDTLVQLQVADHPLTTVLSDRGFMLRKLWAEDDTRGRLTIEVPGTTDTRQAVNLISSQYQEAQLLAKHDTESSSELGDSSAKNILESLTPRQREVIETAYQCGYFDSPRSVTGGETAEMLDLSSATFHQHIRKVEKKLFERLLAGRTTTYPIPDVSSAD